MAHSAHRMRWPFALRYERHVIQRHWATRPSWLYGQSMPDRSSRRALDYVEHAVLQEHRSARLSEREHAVQTALAFGFLLAVSGASIAVSLLLP